MAWEKIFNLFHEKKYTALEREALGFHVQYKRTFAFYDHMYTTIGKDHCAHCNQLTHALKKSHWRIQSWNKSRNSV